MEEKKNFESDRGLLTRKMESGQDVVIQTEMAALLDNVDFPKAQHHFVVLPMEDIGNVTALTRDHLPLLDNMMDLANQIIEQQPSSNFLVGFKMEQFMDRLNMHVISKDFYSDKMRWAKHYNTFNTELFITFQAVYALLKTKGSVDPLPTKKAEELRMLRLVRCNQCAFKTENFPKFKGHLEMHWQKSEKKRQYEMQLSQLKNNFGKMDINRNPLKQAPNKKKQKQGPDSSPPGSNDANPKPHKKRNNKNKTNNQMPSANSKNENAKKPNDA